MIPNKTKQYILMEFLFGNINIKNLSLEHLFWKKTLGMCSVNSTAVLLLGITYCAGYTCTKHEVINLEKLLMYVTTAVDTWKTCITKIIDNSHT